MASGDVAGRRRDATAGRLTLSGAVRFDRYKSSTPPQQLGPVEYLPNRNISIPATPLNDLKDVTYRTGAAYDVFGTGRTAVKVALNKYIESRGAAKVRVATFLDKPKARKAAFTPDYVGFSIEPHFVVGYGLDFDEKYRNLMDVHILTDDLGR